jgi:hypothetical protein
MLCAWLLGLPSAEEARQQLISRLGLPHSPGHWTLGDPESPSVWINFHNEREPWDDTAPEGAMIEARYSTRRIPQSRDLATRFLIDLQAVLGGVFEDELDQAQSRPGDAEP